MACNGEKDFIVTSTIGDKNSKIGGIYVSHDNGLSFVQKENFYLGIGTKISMRSKNAIVACSLEHNDSGIKKFNTKVFISNNTGDNFRNFLLENTNCTSVLALDDFFLIATQDGNVIKGNWIDDDKGKFKTITTAYSSGIYYLISYYNKGNVLLGVCDNFLVKSTDNGQNWSKLTQVTSNKYINGMFYDATKREILLRLGDVQTRKQGYTGDEYNYGLYNTYTHLNTDIQYLVSKDYGESFTTTNTDSVDTRFLYINVAHNTSTVVWTWYEPGSYDSYIYRKEFDYTESLLSSHFEQGHLRGNDGRYVQAFYDFKDGYHSPLHYRHNGTVHDVVLVAPTSPYATKFRMKINPISDYARLLGLTNGVAAFAGKPIRDALQYIQKQNTLQG